MRKIFFTILGLFCIYLTGCCSIPRVDTYKQIYSITREEKNIKKGFGKRKIVLIKDFRENEAFDEDIAALKEKVEKYISSHPDLSETAKNNLRELKVTEAQTKEEVELLLGQPDKVVKKEEKDIASEIWIYQTSHKSVFTIVFLPVFFGHEEYYLYFKDNILTLIEGHYLEQTFYASGSGMGVNDKTKKTAE